MMIKCEVSLMYRELCSMSNHSQKSKGVRSTLAIGKKPGEGNKKYALHHCNTANKKGTTYKISENIKTVFTKFVSEGKFTIRLVEPSLDLCVKADPLQAKAFLKNLKQALDCKELDKTIHTLTPATTKQLVKPKTSLTVTVRKDYPVTAAFPTTLEVIDIKGIQLNRIENRIIKLPRLRVLNMSENLLTSLPLHMNKMSHLAELTLSDNNIDHIQPTLFTENLKHNLRLLDLSQNKIKKMPHTLGQLKKLVTLNLSHNQLTTLPLAVGRLVYLRYLYVGHNQLKDIPASIRHIRLQRLDIEHNGFDSPHEIIFDNTCRVKTLKEAMLIAAITRGLNLTAKDIPLTLLYEMDKWFPCLCGKITLSSCCILARISFNIRCVETVCLDSNSRTIIPGISTFCSKSCYQKFSRRTSR